MNYSRPDLFCRGDIEWEETVERLKDLIAHHFLWSEKNKEYYEARLDYLLNARKPVFSWKFYKTIEDRQGRINKLRKFCETIDEEKLYLALSSLSACGIIRVILLDAIENNRSARELAENVFLNEKFLPRTYLQERRLLKRLYRNLVNKSKFNVGQKVQIKWSKMVREKWRGKRGIITKQNPWNSAPDHLLGAAGRQYEILLDNYQGIVYISERYLSKDVENEGEKLEIHTNN